MPPDSPLNPIPAAGGGMWPTGPLKASSAQFTSAPSMHESYEIDLVKLKALMPPEIDPGTVQFGPYTLKVRKPEHGNCEPGLVMTFRMHLDHIRYSASRLRRRSILDMTAAEIEADFRAALARPST